MITQSMGAARYRSTGPAHLRLRSWVGRSRWAGAYGSVACAAAAPFGVYVGAALGLDVAPAVSLGLVPAAAAVVLGGLAERWPERRPVARVGSRAGAAMFALVLAVMTYTGVATGAEVPSWYPGADDLDHDLDHYDPAPYSAGPDQHTEGL